MIILEKGERADQLWGMDTEIITDEMIEALQQGKRLYLSVNDEYAVVIKKNGKRKTDKPEATDTDTIYRQDAIDAIYALQKDGCIALLDCAVDEVKNLPSAPQRTGHWIPMTCRYVRGAEGFPYLIKKWTEATEPDDIDGLKCSECGEIFDFEEARKWCCECGARMVKGVTSNE